MLYQTLASSMMSKSLPLTDIHLLYLSLCYILKLRLSLWKNTSMFKIHYGFLGVLFIFNKGSSKKYYGYLFIYLRI